MTTENNPFRLPILERIDSDRVKGQAERLILDVCALERRTMYLHSICDHLKSCGEFEARAIFDEKLSGAYAELRESQAALWDLLVVIFADIEATRAREGVSRET